MGRAASKSVVKPARARARVVGPAKDLAPATIEALEAAGAALEKVAGQERFSVQQDGALSNGKVERFALYLADGVEAYQAWRNAGYADSTGYAKTWRKRVEMDPSFQARVAALTAERVEAEAAASPFAMARWTASQLWRDARVAGDLRAAEKAADLLFKIGEREMTMFGSVGSGAGNAPAPAGAGVEGRGPGRPPVELAQSRPKSITDLRAELLDRSKPDTEASPAG